MTDDDRQRLASAPTTFEHKAAMSAEPNTWIKIGVVIAAVVALSVVGTLAWYPWENDKYLPSWWKPIQILSFIPMIGSVVAAAWLLFQSLGLHMMPTVRHTGLVTARDSLPEGQFLELTLADGRVLRQRCRRRAASMVRVGTINPGEVGVALCKGDTVLEWHPVPV